MYHEWNGVIIDAAEIAAWIEILDDLRKTISSMSVNIREKTGCILAETMQ